MASRELSLLMTLQDNVSEDLDNVKGNLEGMKGTFSNMAKWGTAAFAAISGAVVALVYNVGNYADEMLDASEITQISTDRLQKWAYVAGQAGVETNFIQQATKRFSRELVNIEEQSGKAYEALDKLGVETHDGAGEIKGMGDIMEDTMLQLASMEDGTMRNAMAYEIFGGQAESMIPVLAQGSDAIEEQMQKADELGLVLSEEALESANEFRKAQQEMRDVVGSLGRELGMVFAPILTKLVEKIQPIIIQFRDWAKENPKTIKIITGLALLIAGLVSILGLLGLALPKIAIGFAMVTGPIGLTVLAVIALIAIVVALIANWDKVTVFFSNLWDTIKDTFNLAWEWIKDMFLNYTPYGLVIKHWSKITGFFQNLWDGITGIFTDARDFIMDIVNDILGFPGRIVDAVKSIPGLGNLISSAGSVIGVNDAMITSKGDVVKFHPDDNILAMKDFSGLGGGGTVINVSVKDGMYLDRDAGRHLARTLSDELNREIKLAN